MDKKPSQACEAQAMPNTSEPLRWHGHLVPQLPRGFRDYEAKDLESLKRLLETLEQTYRLYGFEALDTPFFEYSDALGKFLPDDDRPNAGVFSCQDDDERWLSLRYDLTAPLARYMAENRKNLPVINRFYRHGWVFRNEKPGPGRFRQFMQCDADIVGISHVTADGEMCLMMCDALEHLGLGADTVVKVSNRKIMDALLDLLSAQTQHALSAAQRLIVLRALDKLDRVGLEGVAALLGGGRRDESGDFTPGAHLPNSAITQALEFLKSRRETNKETLSALRALVGDHPSGRDGVDELEIILAFVGSTREAFSHRVVCDPTVVRGLDYYTGPVYEVDFTRTLVDEKGRVTRFGSIGGGGRYDGLVSRFLRDEILPATGFSFGVSRLLAALEIIKKESLSPPAYNGPVMILALESDRLAAYAMMAQRLRAEGIPAEVYLGTSGLKAQMKYADRRRSPCVVIQGALEREKGIVQLKDMHAGLEQAASLSSNEAFRSARVGQISLPEEQLVKGVKAILEGSSS
jgi:histidyl-tRNA synthetase